MSLTELERHLSTALEGCLVAPGMDYCDRVRQYITTEYPESVFLGEHWWIGDEGQGFFGLGVAIFFRVGHRFLEVNISEGFPIGEGWDFLPDNRSMGLNADSVWGDFYTGMEFRERIERLSKALDHEKARLLALLSELGSKT